MDFASEPSKGHGERILYLDDEEPLVFLATRTLRRLGYEPSGFCFAAHALAAFRQAPRSFDLVMTDLSMPDMNGLEFARELLTTAPGTPVAVISGFVGTQDRARAAAAGVRWMLQKPLTVAELAVMIGRLLQEIRA